MSFKQNQLQPFSLAGSGAVIGATSITLKSMLSIDGDPLTMAGSFGDIGYGTIDPGNNTLEEQISFTGLTNNANGTTTLTGVSSVSFGDPYTSTSGLMKTHAGSAPFVISNTSGFYTQFTRSSADETITGQWTFNVFPVTPSNSDASTTVKGVTKLSTDPAVASNPIAVGTNDVRVPTADPTTLFAPISVVYQPIASDYSDGIVTASTGSLTRDMYYNTLTVPNGVTLTTAGYRIFARSVVVNSGGTITNSGGNGGNASGSTAGTAGTAQSAGTMSAGKAGQAGGAGQGGVGDAGTAGTNSTFNMVSSAGASGGAGGAGNAGAGGAAGAGGTNTSTINPPRNAVSAYYQFDFTSGTAVQKFNVNSGSGSGGGGSGHAGAGGIGGGGGGSGGSGGVVFIAAETITNAGSIIANGGNGGNGGNSNGSGNTGGGGGGGGGNGGVVFLIYSTLTNTGTISANGGNASTGGTASGTGAAGSAGAAGAAGLVIQITK